MNFNIGYKKANLGDYCTWCGMRLENKTGLATFWAIPNSRKHATMSKDGWNLRLILACIIKKSFFEKMWIFFTFILRTLEET